MPPSQDPDELNISVGLSGTEDLEAHLHRLESILQSARKNIDELFSGPSKSAPKFSAHIVDLEKKVVTLTNAYSGIGKAGVSGFDKLNKSQLDAFDNLVKIQSKLQIIDKQLGEKTKPSLLVQLQKEARILEAELLVLDKQLLGLKPLDIIAKRKYADTPKPPPEKRDIELEKAQANIARYQAQRIHWEKNLTKQVDVETDKQAKIRISNFQRALNAVLKGYRTIEQKEAKLTEKSTGGRSPIEAGLSKLGLGGLVGGLGPFAAIVATGFAIQRAYGFAKEAIERASEQARANRTLASSAEEAGVSIEFLNDKNKEFAKLAALSDVQATSTSAKITQLATLAQTPENLADREINGKTQPSLFRAFADLGAARGLDATGIETVVQQIITGQDEGYKKLLLPNPAQLQAKFAKANNRSVESLTAVEKAQIFQAEFLKKAELFNGAAEARLASVDGKAAKLSASFENLANTLSSKFANNYDVANFIDGLTKSFNGLNGEIDDLATKVEQGINIEDLVKSQATPGILGYGAAGINTILSGASVIARVLSTYTTVGLSNATGINKSFEDTGNKLAEDALADVNPDLREDFIRQRINAEIRQRAINRKVENERRVQLAEEKAKEEQVKFAAIEQKRLTEVFKDPRANASTVLKGIADIKKYQNPVEEKVTLEQLTQEIEKRFSKRDLRLDRGRTPLQVMNEIADQALKELQAAADVKNLPLFDPEAKKKLIEEGERTLEQLAKIAHELVRNVQSELVDTLGDRTDNPFVKLLNDADIAAEETERKFARLGPAVAKSMGIIAEQAALHKVALAEFESTDKELKFRQQARRLEELPITQTNAFERRLQRVETETQFQLSQQDTTRGIVESQFYGSTQATGKARKIREAFLRSQYGNQYQDLVTGARGTREEKDAYREIGVRIKESQKDVDKARGVGLQGLGVYGRGAIAEQLLGRLPANDELLSRLRGQGRGREEAQGLFRTRQDLLKDKQAADEQRFKDFINTQKFTELNRKDAEERARNLFDKGGALTEKDKLDKFLSITDELGTAELTPELRQQRIKALNARADIEATEKKVAQDQLKTITDFVSALKTQVEAGGLKVTLSETPIVEVQINSSGVEAELANRPSSNR